MQEAPGGPWKPQEATGSSRRPEEAQESSGKIQDPPGGTAGIQEATVSSKRFQEAPGGSRRLHGATGGLRSTDRRHFGSVEGYSHSRTLPGSAHPCALLQNSSSPNAGTPSRTTPPARHPAPHHSLLGCRLQSHSPGILCALSWKNARRCVWGTCIQKNSRLIILHLIFFRVAFLFPVD